MKKYQANGILLLTALLWGGGYLLIKQALLADMPAGMINALRGFIFVALIFICFFKRILRMKRNEFKTGAIAGLLYFLCIQTQTSGLKYTTPSNSAFITSLYIVVIPFIAWLLFKQKPARQTYWAIAFCLVGMFFITNMVETGLHIRLGDFLTLLSAFCCAIWIIYYSRSMSEKDPINIAFALGFTQFLISMGWSLLFERSQYTLIQWHKAIVPILLLGIFVSFIGQTLQIIGQQHADSTISGLLLMTEAIFSALFSVVFGFEKLNSNLLIGGCFIILGLMICQIDVKKWRNKGYLNKQT